MSLQSCLGSGKFILEFYFHYWQQSCYSWLMMLRTLKTLRSRGESWRSWEAGSWALGARLGLDVGEGWGGGVGLGVSCVLKLES
eukprot:gene9366-19426_t